MSRRSVPLRSHPGGSGALNMKRVSTILVCVLILVLYLSAAKTTRSTARLKTNEPFRTFELLDSRLAKLNREQDEIKRAITPGATKATSTKPNGHSHPWTRPARHASRTATSLKVLADRQQRRYRTAKQPFGVRAFHALSKRAAAVQISAMLLSRTQDDALAAKRNAVFERDALSLVLQYQALAGGYGAMHCSAGQTPCCQQKEEPSQPPSEKVLGCKWLCVSSPKACRKGFTGSPIATHH
jgi:hypothetical protein